MSIFNSKKKEISKPLTAKKTKKLAVVPEKSVKAVRIGSAMPHFDISGIILRPKITEKVTLLSDNGENKVVMFEVSRKANKQNVSLAIQSLYKVVPVKIAVLRVPPKKSFVRGRPSYGITRYKAYVYLKKGDNIEIV